MLLQLADFGLSRVMETNATHISTNTIGTIAYQPEEVTTSFIAAFVSACARTGQTALDYRLPSIVKCSEGYLTAFHVGA